MAGQRFYSRDSLKRRTSARVLVVVATFLGLFAGWLMTRIDLAAGIGILSLSLVALMAGAIQWRRATVFLAVDPGTRMVTAVHGTVREILTLDTFGPLSVTRFEKSTTSNDDQPTEPTHEFVVTGVVHGDIELVVAPNAESARIVMEELALRDLRSFFERPSFASRLKGLNMATFIGRSPTFRK